MRIKNPFTFVFREIISLLDMLFHPDFRAVAKKRGLPYGFVQLLGVAMYPILLWPYFLLTTLMACRPSPPTTAETIISLLFLLYPLLLMANRAAALRLYKRSEEAALALAAIPYIAYAVAFFFFINTLFQ